MLGAQGTLYLTVAPITHSEGWVWGRGEFCSLYNTETADRRAILFWLATLGNPRHIVLDRGSDLPWKGKKIRCDLRQITLATYVFYNGIEIYWKRRPTNHVFKFAFNDRCVRACCCSWFLCFCFFLCCFVCLLVLRLLLFLFFFLFLLLLACDTTSKIKKGYTCCLSLHASSSYSLSIATPTV